MKRVRIAWHVFVMCLSAGYTALWSIQAMNGIEARKPIVVVLCLFAMAYICALPGVLSFRKLIVK
jgi:hypothetical protein